LEGGVVRGHREPETHPGDWLGSVHPEDRARTREAWRRAVAAPSLYDIEHRVLAADGGYRHLLSRGVPVRNAKGEVLEWIGASADVTERKQAEVALREREAQLAFAQRVGRVGVWGRDLLTGTVFVSPEWCDIVGIPDPALVRSFPAFLTLVHPDDRPRVQAADRQAIETGGDMDVELRVLHPERGERWILSRARRLASADGRGHRLLGVIIDITEQKRTEEALRASEERLRRAVQIDTVGVLFFKTDGRITDANDAFLRMSGCSREELTQGRVRWDELTPPEWMAASRQAVAEFEATGRTTPYQKEYVRKDGTRWWGLFAAARIEPDEGVEFVIDVSEQKRADERLRASEERLRFAAQAAGFGIYELDLVTGQAHRSPEYKALFGLEPDDEFRLDADQVPIYVHPDDRALLRKATRESRDPRGPGVKDVEYRVLLPDGAVRWLLVRGRVSFEGAGKARRAVRSRGVALDVTERKQLEQEVLDISGREQRRIGHDLHDDLCQRLGGLQLLSGVLEKELAAAASPQAPQAGRIQELVHEALERARLLARGLSPVAVEEGGLASALQELADNAAQLFGLRCEFQGEPVGLADAGAATHLYRIAQEAINNAVKHGRARRVVIGLTDAGDCFELKVVDDGRGFARTTAALAGMGLRIMKYRAAMLGATLEVQSAPGQGTTVTCAFGKGLCSARRPAKARLRVGRGGRQAK
jgi:PAS domain S-box-containing protein